MNIQRPASLRDFQFDSWNRLSQFAAQPGKALREQLGWGYEGLVYATISKTAVKAYRHEHLYQKERDVYIRLRRNRVSSANLFTIPKLIAYSNELWVVEMSIVSPPFILDFAGAYLDEKPPFSKEELEAWEIEKMEQFEDRWPEVRSAMNTFRRHGIYLNDVKPGNVAFADEAR